MSKWVDFWNKVTNSKLRKEIPRPDCCLIVGQKRTGKSTFFVPVAQYYLSIGYKVFCNFPMKNSYAIPVKEVYDKKSNSYITIIDKDWLFNADLRYSVVLIDEASAIWGSRDYATSWTARDTQWFTELGKNHTVVFMITQYFDLIDLNCKRSCDEQIFLTKSRWFRNITLCDFSELASLPVTDKLEVVNVKGLKGFYHETWEICARHFMSCRMYRRPFYNMFDTEFSFKKQEPVDFAKMIYWEDVISFDKHDEWLISVFDYAYAHIRSLSITNASSTAYC